MWPTFVVPQKKKKKKEGEKHQTTQQIFDHNYANSD